MLRFAITLLVAGLTATAHAQLPTTAQARAKELKERITITTFRLELLYHGNEEKPFYRLILSVPPIKNDHSNPFYRIAQVSEEQAGKIIDRLATDGFLTKAVDLRPKQESLPPPTEPSYTLKVGIYYENLGWGLPMLKRLDGLRKVLDSDAATGMDFLLVRLSGFRKLWEKEAIAQIADHTEAIRLNPRDATAYYNRGLAYRQLGDETKAAEDFVQAQKLGNKPP